MFVSDVTINEFANSNLVRKCKRIRKKNAISIIDDEDDVDVEIRMANLKLKQGADAAVCDEQKYSTYPNDVWYLISEFIQPEDVQNFALICKQTYAITTTMKFWRALYKRHYTDHVELPVRLQPDCMARPGGIRACSIRSLYFTYAPFIQRLLKQPKQDFHLLKKRYVERFWFSQITSIKWQYFYKLRQRPMSGGRIAESEALHRRNVTCLRSLQDVYLNSEEGCALLVVSTAHIVRVKLDHILRAILISTNFPFTAQIESTKFHPLPCLLDEMETANNIILSSIGHHLTGSCNNYRLEMQFAGTSRHIVGNIVYEPAIDIRVYDWWTPTYAKYVKQGVQPNLEYIRDHNEAIDDEPGMTDDDAWDYVINRLS